MSKSNIGLIGLAVMGENLVLNMESKGFRVAVYNRTTAVTDKFAENRAKGKNIVPCRTLEEFVGALDRPRKVQIMVKAGAPVDAVIAQLVPLLEAGDIIIDGGNSLWTDTQRREKSLREQGIHFFGVGVSGGEEGALKGPSIMPGGSAEGWKVLEPIYTKIAAVAEGEPCCRHMGTDGAGHYVKMVHNGIEYGDMQLICEAYAILQATVAPTAEEFAAIFSEWNHGDLDSFLIDITANIFGRKDALTGKPLVDVILDKAGQKGTGKWTVGHAVEMGVPLSVIGSAVEARILSSMKAERVEAAGVLPAPEPKNWSGDRQALVNAVRDALYASKIISYAQGFVQLGAASELYGWSLNFGDISSIWRGGCIIRARFLNRITEAYRSNPSLKNLILDPYFRDMIAKSQSNWRTAVQTAIEYGVAAPAFSAALSYYDSCRSARLPANLLQAQRDYFGAHTYERTDKPAGEFFHTEWFG
ncbi:MAG: decarboxylating NADP(+)-dependent phosphogluconate dehydrogenase [Verrucomicrobia bacterium]|nr:decarboxylating NADP(+)-dependent phosphogluconate dehydrogenase [Verrucomicrobiota bacterium]